MTKKGAAKKVAAKKVATKKVVARKPAAKKVASKKTSAKKASTRTAARKPAARKIAPRTDITPEQALANTQRLLAEKQARAHETPPWQEIGHEGSHVPESGFQSNEARDQANHRHDDEMRLQGNQGSIGTQDRHAQGKRDSRG